MFKLTHKIPDKFWIAVSGGVDSMAALYFLNTESNKNRFKGVIHIDHNTGKFSKLASKLILKYCVDNGIVCDHYKLKIHPPNRKSKEAWWRDRRYEIFDQYDEQIVLGHHLDDCIEEYIMCTMVRGFSSTIQYQRGNCVRPFRLWRKRDIYLYAESNKIPFLEDPSNADTKYKRNLIRNKLLPVAYQLNPGLHKIVTRLIKAKDKSSNEKIC